MTSIVVVTAHCAKTKEVEVKITSNFDPELSKLQDGESAEYCVYDDREISVREVER